MALTLKTTGIATALAMCLAVDDDGATIKEFVSTDVDSNKTVDGSVAVGTSTWKGSSRGYFATTANGSFNFHGISFATSHQPTLSDRDTDGIAYFIAFAYATAGSGISTFLKGSALGLGRSSNKLSLYAGSFVGAGATTLPTDGATKFSVGLNHQDSAGDAYYFGLESGSMATDGSASNSAGFGNATDNTQSVGGWSGQGNAPGGYHLVATFTRQLTTVEMQSLHNDWFNTLFNQTVTTARGGLLLLGAG